LLALLSCLLLPAPSLGLVLAQKLVQTFHMVDLNQLYTILFCVWFLLLAPSNSSCCVSSGAAGFHWRRKPVKSRMP
jgi:hypothetical protein